MLFMPEILLVTKLITKCLFIFAKNVF